MSDTANDSQTPVLGQLQSYRDWIGSQSFGMGLLIVVASFVVMGAVGLAVDTLQSTIGALLTQLITWIVLLGVLYTIYAFVRSLLS